MYKPKYLTKITIRMLKGQNSICETNKRINKMNKYAYSNSLI